MTIQSHALFILGNVNNCHYIYRITSERMGCSNLKTAVNCVHEYNKMALNACFYMSALDLQISQELAGIILLQHSQIGIIKFPVIMNQIVAETSHLLH